MYGQGCGEMRGLFYTFIFYYLLISFLEFSFYKDFIFSKDTIVILTALGIAGFNKLIVGIKSLSIFDPYKKSNRYFIRPIISAIEAYIVLAVISLSVLQEFTLKLASTLIFVAVLIAIMESSEKKIDDISPRDPKKEPRKPLKYYIDKFIIHATPFHKLMYVIYGISICLLIIAVILFY